jgi:hypothetical protein
MKCTFCPQKFVIRTDPKNADYEYLSGLRKKARPERGHSETAKQKTNEQALALINDAFFKLEHVGDDKRAAATANERLAALADIQEARFADSYESNAVLRKAARAQRHAAANLTAEARGLHFSGALLPKSEEDSAGAAAAIAARDLHRLEQGHLRSSSGGGSAAYALPTASPAIHSRIDSASQLLLRESSTSASSRPLASPPPRLPVAAIGTKPLGVQVAEARASLEANRLAAIGASFASVSSASLLPAGRAAQILGAPLPSRAFKRATAPPTTTAKHLAPAPLAGHKRSR